MLTYLADVEAKLLSSGPSGGLPDSAREQLRHFMELYGQLTDSKSQIARLQKEGQSLLGRTSDAAAYRLQNDLLALQQRWDNVMERASERKTKLEVALSNVEQFHSDLAKFIKWLTQTEKALNQLRPVSRLLPLVNEQIVAHTALKKEISSKREEILRLDRQGTHLKYFSQKQDVILIKNLLASIHHRWERIVSRSSDRTRHLDNGFKEAKKFLDMWTSLTDWLQQQLKVLADDQSIGNTADTIRAQVERHRDFQRALGAKNPAYDAIRRLGKQLIDRSPVTDHQELERMLTEMKQLWNAVCNRSLERQRNLEDALLHSGQYKEALSALLEWLHQVEPELTNEGKCCHGDLDTVMTLVEKHNRFESEMNRRRQSIEFVRSSAKDLMAKSDEDSSEMHEQLVDLMALWEKVVNLCQVSCKF